MSEEHAGCPASYFFLLFGISPTFSYFLALEGKISSYFLLLSWNSVTFLDFVSKICNFQVNFEDFRFFFDFEDIKKFLFNFEKISLFLTCEIFEKCSVAEIVNKVKS